MALVVLQRLRAGFQTEEGSSLKSSLRLVVSMGAARTALFIAFVLLLRHMRAVAFGTFYIGYSTLAIVPLLADFGLGQTFVRHISFYRTSRPSFARYLQWLFFVLKSLSVGVLIVLALPLVSLLARFLNLQNQQSFLAIAIIGSGGVIFYDYVTTVFQIGRLFRRYEVYIFLRNVLFLTSAVALMTLKPDLLTPTALIFCVVFFHTALALSGFRYISKQWDGRAGKFADFRSSLFRYSKWLTVAGYCFALYRRMDVYYLSHFRTLREVGVYSAGAVLAEPIAMLSPALVSVFLPKLSGEPTRSKLSRYFHLVLLVCSVVAVGVIGYLGVLRLALSLLGAEFRTAYPVTAFLLLGTVLLIGYNMLSILFLASDHPELFGGIAMAMAGSNMLANWFVVPTFGVIGAAVVYGCSQLLGVLLGTFFLRRLLNSGRLFVRVDAETAVDAEAAVSVY